MNDQRPYKTLVVTTLGISACVAFYLFGLNRKAAETNGAIDKGKPNPVLTLDKVPNQNELVRSIKTSQQAYAFVGGTRISNPDILKEIPALDLKAPEVQSLSGEHLGKIQLISPSGEVQNFEMALAYNPLINPKQIKFRIGADRRHMTTSEFQTSLSKMTGVGPAPDTLVIDLGSKYYLQLYYFPNLQTWYGNVYGIDGKTGRLGYVGATAFRK